MNASSDCPDVNDLRDLAAGRLVEARWVREHLAICAGCRGLLEGMGLGSGSGSRDATEPLDGPQPTGLPTTLAEPPGRDGDEEDDLDLSFLGPATRPDALGRLGDYDVLAVLGRGGMGVVLKAFDEALHRVVAIKVLSPRLASSAKARRRFLREARSAAAINHPNVVTIHAVSDQGGMPFLVMECVAGASLRDRLRAGPMDPEDALRIAEQVAAGLAAAHERGVIHRDIKPANIMLEEGVERVKITDFGLALAAMDLSEATSLEQVVGTPAYMSPEQVQGLTIDPRSDLFGLGCVLYAMLLGHSPFRGTHTVEVVRKVCDLHPPAPHALDPSIPRPLSDVVMRLLAKDPRDRFATAAEAAAVLRSLLVAANRDSIEKGSAETLVLPRRRRQRRRWPVAPAALALAALALGIALALAWRGRKEVVPPPVAGRPAGLITVARSGPADFDNLGQALGKAGPGATIRFLDDATYTEAPVMISGPDRLRGLTIEAPRGATLAASPGEPVLTIKATPEVAVRGLRLRVQAGQHAILIEGPSEGVAIERVRVERPTQGDQPAAILVHRGAAGSARRPIALRELEVETGGLGVAIFGKGRPVCSLRLERCRFTGGGVHVLVADDVRDLTIAGNVFVGGVDGVNFELSEPARGLVVANNTFLDTAFWLGLVPAGVRREGVTLCNNLILGARQIHADEPEWRAEVADRWAFRANWWEPSSETDPDAGLEGRIAVLKPRIPLLSRDPRSPDFLRPPAGSPLATAGAGGAHPRYVGAVPPAPFDAARLAEAGPFAR
jgi:eukaryotic-like serine/threonine-protein kinase